MTRIGADGVEALASVIRKQVEALSRPVAGAPTVRGASTAPRTKKRQKGEDLAGVVARRVRALDPADPDASDKAFHLFLESVLLAEFGEHLINDPAFHLLVDSVQLQMAQDPALVAMMSKAAAALLGSVSK